MKCSLGYLKLKKTHLIGLVLKETRSLNDYGVAFMENSLYTIGLTYAMQELRIMPCSEESGFAWYIFIFFLSSGYVIFENLKVSTLLIHTSSYM